MTDTFTVRALAEALDVTTDTIIGAADGHLCKFADPIEGARNGLSAYDARDIARDDVGLLYLERWCALEVVGRTLAHLSAAEGGDGSVWAPSDVLAGDWNVMVEVFSDDDGEVSDDDARVLLKNYGVALR